MSSLYDDDTYTWAMTQAEALRRRGGTELDWENVAEEIEGLARSEARELASRLAVLLAHLLKWRFLPERRGASWETTIKTQRRLIAIHLAKNPGLKFKLDEALSEAFVQAAGAAALETGPPLEAFPQASPFTFEQAMDEAFFPETPTAPK